MLAEPSIYVSDYDALRDMLLRAIEIIEQRGPSGQELYDKPAREFLAEVDEWLDPPRNMAGGIILPA